MNLVKYWRGSYILKNVSSRLIDQTLKEQINKERVVFNADFVVQSKYELLKSKEIVKGK